MSALHEVLLPIGASSKVVGGVLVLERSPVAVKVWEGPKPEVWIEVMPRSKPASLAEVASLYEQT